MTRIDIDQTRWYDRIWASLIFFTRLPFWRLHQPPRQCYNAVVEHWPLTGWLTAAIMAATLWLGSMIMPYTVAVIIAVAARMLTTGALHEDGLADFFDAFGAGGTRQRILAIMKDSHIGTYGTLALITYVLLLVSALSAITPRMAVLTIMAADPFAKMVTAQMVTMMPYARSEEEAKAHVVYRKMSWQAGVSIALQGLLPMTLFILMTGISWEPVVFLPCLLMYFLYMIIWRKLRGYTGDCCGAVCLLTELAVYIVVCTQL